jgi:probable HAF family extracellular repeat protein
MDMRLRNVISEFCRLSNYLLIASLFMPVAVAAELPKFQIKKLGALGEEASVGFAISDGGQATGYIGATPTEFSTPPRLGPFPVFQVTGRAFLYSDGTMKDLGTFGGTWSLGRDVNSAGQVTGTATIVHSAIDYPGGPPRAFLFSNGTMTNLGPGPSAGGVASHGIDINFKGQVAGMHQNTEEDGFAFLVSNGQPMTSADLFTGGENVYVTALNNAGHVTGHRAPINEDEQCLSEFPSIICGFQAFVQKNGSTIELGTLGGYFSESAAINALSQITGVAGTSTRNATHQAGIPHAFLYSDGEMKDLGTLGGLTSSGRAINNGGQVTGFAQTAAGHEHAFLWDGAAMRDLGTLGGTTSRGHAINTRGWVTGLSTTTADTGNRAFLSDGGLMTDLNSLIDPADPLKAHVTLKSGVDINNAGQILANGRDKRTNKFHAFVASPMEYQALFITPTTGSKPKVGSTLSVKVALVDINNKRITDARALSLVASPCQVKFSASGAQTKAASCMKYDATNNVFFFNWKLGTAGIGSATLKVAATYQFSVPATVTARQSRTVTIIQ